MLDVSARKDERLMGIDVLVWEDAALDANAVETEQR